MLLHYFKHISLFLFCLLLSGCKSQFLDVRDVKPYEPPALSVSELQKEIEELKLGRDTQKNKINA